MRGERVQRGRQFPEHDGPRPAGCGQHGNRGQVPAGADHQGRGRERRLGLRAQGRAVHAHDGDHAAVTHSGLVAATTRAPLKSTIATSAVSLPWPARSSTDLTRWHNSSPAGRSSSSRCQIS